jgi:phosphoglycerol transferase MdoB-like AlkP superfamily enzyme
VDADADADPARSPHYGDALPPEAHRRARRYGWLYTAAAVVLMPWIVYLAVSLPKRNFDLHYRAAWVGFDVILVIAIVRTAYLAFRVDPRIQLSATVTATLLFVDAWFDIMTSGSHRQILEALVLAAVIEIPAALFTMSLARRVNRQVLERALGEGAGSGRGRAGLARRLRHH